MDERWHSVEEIARHLGVAADTVYRWITRKALPAHRIGRLWKFKVAEVDEWVRSGSANEDVRVSGKTRSPRHKRRAR
ncbi:MAG: helix-turn-helix domain-containing protein [Candidatus Binatia bacterium]